MPTQEILHETPKTTVRDGTYKISEKHQSRLQVDNAFKGQIEKIPDTWIGLNISHEHCYI